METLLHSYLSPNQLFQMAMFVQRAVDYSIKSYELGTAEIQQLFWKHDQEWLNLNRHIASRGRILVAAGTLAVDGSQKSDSALQIYSALQVAYKAATEIAHSAAILASRKPTTPSPQLGEVGSYVNSLVRLCTVALFNQEAQHARKILFDQQGKQWCEMMLFHMRCLLAVNPGAQARLELAIADALEQIAEQAYEIACAVSSTSPDGDKRFDAARETHRSACGGREKRWHHPTCGANRIEDVPTTLFANMDSQTGSALGMRAVFHSIRV